MSTERWWRRFSQLLRIGPRRSHLSTERLNAMLLRAFFSVYPLVCFSASLCGEQGRRSQSSGIGHNRRLAAIRTPSSPSNPPSLAPFIVSRFSILSLPVLAFSIFSPYHHRLTTLMLPPSSSRPPLSLCADVAKSTPVTPAVIICAYVSANPSRGFQAGNPMCVRDNYSVLLPLASDRGSALTAAEPLSAHRHHPQIP